MTSNDTALDILGDCEVAVLDDTVDLSDSRKFTKLSLTQGQQIQISGLMSQLPALAGVDALSKTMTLTFPKGVQGVLMKLKIGGYSTVLQNSETGRIVGTTSMNFAAPQAAALGAFTAISIASGQYFLAQINNSLTQISSGLDKILEFLYGDKRAELLSEVSFIRFAYKNYTSVMEHSEQRIATLISLQNAKKVAMKDIEFYLSDLSSTMTDKKSGDIPSIVHKMTRTKDCLDLSLQLYTMSSLLEVYYSENYDRNYISSVQSEAAGYIDRCEKRSLKCFGQLQHTLVEAKEGIFAKIDKADKAGYIQQIDAIVIELEEAADSPLQTTLRMTLDEIEKEKKYYMTQDGVIYLETA